MADMAGMAWAGDMGLIARDIVVAAGTVVEEWVDMVEEWEVDTVAGMDVADMVAE